MSSYTYSISKRTDVKDLVSLIPTHWDEIKANLSMTTSKSRNIVDYDLTWPAGLSDFKLSVDSDETLKIIFGNDMPSKVTVEARVPKSLNARDSRIYEAKEAIEYLIEKGYDLTSLSVYSYRYSPLVYGGGEITEHFLKIDTKKNIIRVYSEDKSSGIEMIIKKLKELHLKTVN